jgi:hypothetical protein
MRIIVPVGQTALVTYGGGCPQGGLLMLSDPGPGFGFSDLDEYGAGPWTHLWTATKPGVRNLDVAWACTTPAMCPMGWLGVITVTNPG